jgi:8-oxo-dGTP pyrophosphatase MutT (NUDIX family)
VPDVDRLQRQAEADGRRCCAAAVIFDERGRVFSPRRASSSASMPDLWDLVGGHLEAGETVLEGLRREVFEETGWTVVGEPQLVFVCDWELPQEPGDPRREFDYIVSVAGDLDLPTLAPGEHSTHRWVARDEVACFDENGGLDLGLVRRIVEAALAARPETVPGAPHATLLLEPRSPVLEELRATWDPVMAAQIGAHVSVSYPSEIADERDLVARVRHAARIVPSFTLRLGDVRHGGDPDAGIFVAVEDLDGGWQALRAAITGPAGDDAVDPHVTLVHPRTSGLGATAWPELRDRDLSMVFDVRAVAGTAFDGDRWAILEQHALG